ncbi:MAG: sigma-70 family RNA polymerase sigma factor [Acidobacteriaceae bacterium]
MENYSCLSIEELVRQCSASRSADAWEEFIRRFHRLIATVILRTAARLGDSSRQTVDDLIQETYLKLCTDNFRILRNFQQQRPDAFIGYVKVVAANVVRDHFKSSYSLKRGSGHIEQLAQDFVPLAADGSDGSQQSIERTVLIEEINRFLEICVPGPDQERNTQIFWLHYRAGLSARAIADLPGIMLTTKGIESIILRITRELRTRMADRNGAEPAIAPASREGLLPAQSF